MESASVDYVTDEEKLYRRVRRNSDAFQVLQDGKYRVTSQAFGDRKAMQPLVDRAILRGNDPKNSRIDLDDYVLSLFAGSVRSEVSVARMRDGVMQSCVVDVVADPMLENPSHAVITAVPTFEITEDKLFKRLKQALAALAGWEIGPAGSS